MMIVPALRPARPKLLPLGFILAGFMPVSSIALHCIGVLPLQLCLFFLVVPMFAGMFLLGMLEPGMTRVAARGWVAGVIAVALYDCSRLPFMLYGWGDFIPKIGAWLLDTEHPGAWVGYAWRYIGNGGGLGVAFFMLLKVTGFNRNFIRAGIEFGLFVFLCLVILLCVFKEAQDMMFRITSLTFAGSLTGHVIYGVTLGFMARRFFAPRK